MAIPPTDSELIQADNPTNVPRPAPVPSKAPLNAPADYVPAWVPDAQSPIPALTPSAAPPQAIPSIVINTEPKPDNTPPALAWSNSEAEMDVEDEEEDDDAASANELIPQLLAEAPAWLVSLVLHVILLIVLALIFIPQFVAGPIEIRFFSEKVGEQLDTELFKLNDAPLHETLIDADSLLDEADDPLASMDTELFESAEQPIAKSEFSAPHIGIALTGREEGMRETLMDLYGGDESTESAVYLALEWLKRQQQRDGSWRLDRPFDNDGNKVNPNPLAATSLALLAFQGAGFTHKSARDIVNERGQPVTADYKLLIERAWDKMLSWQETNGRFYRNANVRNEHSRLYSQAQATIAICELYGMTRDPKFRRPAQRAINYCVQIQDDDGEFPDGGWRYKPGTQSDTSVTGWFAMALQSAQMAGLDVPSDAFSNISGFLDAVTDDGTHYSYQPRMYPKDSMTAEGLLCRQYLGWKQDDPRLIEGAKYVLRHPIDWSEPKTYYWYYATQFMHHMEGDYWFEWNAVMKKQLTRMQIREGKEKGSWPIEGDRWALNGGGRLYQTCMCTFMLEVYYRHLPIYAEL